MFEVFDKYKNIIKNYEISLWENEPLTCRFKARISLIDGICFIVKDYLFLDGRKYSYQWQDNDGNLIIRWDNASHWKKIETFPHHRHEKDVILSSNEITLEDVLNYISKIILM
jgi:hypothetical protein